MKKTILFFASLLMLCTVHAQKVTLSPEAGISAVFRPGYGEGWRPSTKVGVSADFGITEHFSIESGLFYAFRGYSVDGGIYSNGNAAWNEKVSRTRHFLQLPIMAKFNWTVAPDTKIFFGAGPYVALCLKNRITNDNGLVSGSGSDQHDINWGGYTYGEDQFGNSNQYLYEKERNFDWGVTANVGIEVRNWYAKLQYDLSLGKESSTDTVDPHYHTLTLSLGYHFHL